MLEDMEKICDKVLELRNMYMVIIENTEKLKKILEKEKKEEKTSKKGSKCSKSGKDYEKKVYNIVKYCYLNGEKINKQNEKELGGSSSRCDLMLIKNAGVEIKRGFVPDWSQCSIIFDNKTMSWIAKPDGRNLNEVKKIFNKLLKGHKLFNGKNPLNEKKMLHREWKELKEKTKDYVDNFINIPSDTIKEIYKLKGCAYIQIHKFGLFHLGKDVLEFDVPEFNIEQIMRIRIKVHSTGIVENEPDKNCTLSVTASLRPKDIDSFKPLKRKFQYSLDKIKKLPKNLIYKQ